MFEPWHLALIDEAGYNGIRDEHITSLMESLRKAGETSPDRRTIDYHCRKCGITPSNLKDEDIKKLKDRLKRI